MFKNLKFHELSERRATETNVRQFQEEFDLRLPPAFVDFCYQYNGGYPLGAEFIVPPRFEAFHAEYPFNKGLRVDFLFGLNSTIEQLAVTRKRKFFEKSSTFRLLPVGEDLLGNFVVVRCDTPEGNVHWLDHEIWDASGEPYLLSIAQDLRFFYENLRSKEE